jgi:hypothetical protein
MPGRDSYSRAPPTAFGAFHILKRGDRTSSFRSYGVMNEKSKKYAEEVFLWVSGMT